MFDGLTFWQGFIAGAFLGFLLGVIAMAFFKRQGYKGEDILAWILAVTWVMWHLIAAFTDIASVPPTMYDIVSGGAVGFILGEKFFDYIAGSVKRMRN